MENSKIKEKLLSSNKNSRLEKFGKSLTFLCIALIVFVVGAILVFVAQKGLSTFYSDGVNPFRFLLEQIGHRVILALTVNLQLAHCRCLRGH